MADRDLYARVCSDLKRRPLDDRRIYVLATVEAILRMSRSDAQKVRDVGLVLRAFRDTRPAGQVHAAHDGVLAALAESAAG
jgi:hypothetical protein